MPWIVGSCRLETKEGVWTGFPLSGLGSEAVDAALPPDRERPVAALQRVHAARQGAALELELLHEFPHEDVLVRVHGVAGLVLEEGHEGFHGAAGFVLGRGVGRGVAARGRVRRWAHG